MDYAEELKRRQDQLDGLAPRLASIRSAFVGHATEHLKDLILRMAKSEVERKTDITLKVSDAALGKMKQRVRSLAESAEALATEYLGKEDLWRLPENASPHEILPASLSQHDLSRRLEEGLRLAVGQLGPILAEHGYVTTSAQTERGKLDVWCEYDSSGNRYQPGGRPRYPYALDWSSQLKQDMLEYTTCAAEVAKIRHEMTRLKSEWDSHKAKSKWDAL